MKMLDGNIKFKINIVGIVMALLIMSCSDDSNHNLNDQRPVGISFNDENFKSALLHNYPEIDNNNDGEITEQEAATKTGMLYLVEEGIQDFTGIEHFSQIDSLMVSFNYEVSALDVSPFENLLYLRCAGMKIKELDLSNNPKLAYLDCEVNEIEVLNLTQNTELKKLFAFSNKLQNPDLSNNLKLEVVGLSRNLFTDIDLSHHTQLNRVTIISDYLVTANVANGNNDILENLHISGNALNCIQVDDISKYRTHWLKSPYAEWSENCQ